MESCAATSGRTPDGGGQPRRSRAPILRAARLLPLLALFTGCADCRFLKQTCPPPPDPTAAGHAPAPAAAYRIGCPDVLEVTFADHPDWDAVAAVDLDGRLPLPGPGAPRAEGRTLDDVRDELAELANTPPERVALRLAAARSSWVYLHGPIRGRSRVVPYQGPEPAIDFLRRVGGLPPGSKLSQVYVVRPNVAAGGRPEVFPVDVPAVLLDGDHATNVPLKPSDEVYVGETTRSVFSRILPDWVSPLYRRLTGLLPDEWWPFTRTRLP